ncbi:MAG: DUF2344 domain-containing protein [Chloroflexi bacterium]|nr:DUF2344 domain-containing protein [Chloroflexota bacterium]
MAPEPDPISEGAPAAGAETPLGLPRGFGPAGRAGAAPMQRVRLTFAKNAPIRFISHLDVVRLWERTFRRARLPLAYTLGFTPHPRLAFAAPLALGATGGAELVDVYLAEHLDPAALAARLRECLPPGCEVIAAREVQLQGPALMALVRWAEYRVAAVAARAGDVEPDESGTAADGAQGSRWARGAAGARPTPADIEAAPGAGVPWRPPAERLTPPAPLPPLPPRDEIERRIHVFLDAAGVPWTRCREGKAATVDLRPLVIDVWIEHERRGRPAEPDTIDLVMLVRLDPSGAGRPEEVAAALGLQTRRIHRTRIGLEGEPPGRRVQNAQCTMQSERRNLVRITPGTP